MSKIYVMAYGTLKKGCSRDLLALAEDFGFKADYVGEDCINNKVLHMTTYGYPIMTDKEDSFVYVDVFRVDEKILPILDMVEGVGQGLYKRVYGVFGKHKSVYYDWTYKHQFVSIGETDRWTETVIEAKGE